MPFHSNKAMIYRDIIVLDRYICEAAFFFAVLAS